MGTLTIGQLAEAAGVNVETVRYYERRGLLASPPRTPAGYRQYGDGDVWRLELIARAKDLGFTLRETAELLGDGAARSRDAVVRAARDKIAEVDRDIAALRARRDRLADLIEQCDGGIDADCLTLRRCR